MKVVFPIICSGATVVPQKSVLFPLRINLTDTRSPTNIILTGLATAIAVNACFAKRYPNLHGQYVYVVR